MNIIQNAWAVAVLSLLLNQFIPLSWITPISKWARSMSYLWPWKIFLILTQGHSMSLAFFIIKIFINSVNLQAYSLRKQTRTSTLRIRAWNSCLPWPSSSTLYNRLFHLSGTTLDLASERLLPHGPPSSLTAASRSASMGLAPAPTLHTSPAARW